MKPIEIGSFEEKNKLSELLVMAERGQRVMITLRGKRVAMLTAPEDDAAGQKKLSSDEVVEGFRALHAGTRKGGGSLKSLIEAERGRRDETARRGSPKS